MYIYCNGYIEKLFMNIKITQQVSATYARNNFKKVVDQAVKDGVCWIMRKSKPVTIMLSLSEYKKMQDCIEAFQQKDCKKKAAKKYP